MQSAAGDFICSVVKFFRVHGNLYRKSGEHCSGMLLNSLCLCTKRIYRQMVGSLHGLYVILNLPQSSCRQAWLAFFREDARGANSSSESIPIPVCWWSCSEGEATLG